MLLGTIEDHNGGYRIRWANGKLFGKMQSPAILEQALHALYDDDTHQIYVVGDRVALAEFDTPVPAGHPTRLAHTTALLARMFAITEDRASNARTEIGTGAKAPGGRDYLLNREEALALKAKCRGPGRPRSKDALKGK